jgi:hypothetical protein
MKLPIHRNHFAPLLFAIAVLLQGCAWLGLSTTSDFDTFNKRAAAAIGTVAQVRNSAADLLMGGVISNEDARNVLMQTDAAREGIVLAGQMYSRECPVVPGTGSPDPTCQASAANARLSSTVAVLTALQTYLATKQGAKK